MLTPATLAAGRFGKLWESPELDGFGKFPARLYASPLYVDGLKIQTKEHNGKTFHVLIAANEHRLCICHQRDPVERGCSRCNPLEDPIRCSLHPALGRRAMGIVGTPVIDKARKHSMFVSCGEATSFRMYGLDLSTGMVLDGWPVAMDEKSTRTTVNQSQSALWRHPHSAFGGRVGFRSSVARSTSAPTIAIFSPPSARVAGWVYWRSTRSARLSRQHSAARR